MCITNYRLLEDNTFPHTGDWVSFSVDGVTILLKIWKLL